MTEKRLEQYRATKIEIAQLEEKIRKLKSKAYNTVTDTVTTAANFPYNKHTLLISGIDFDDYYLREQRMQLKLTELLIRAQKELEELEDYIADIEDSCLRVIMRYRYIDNWGWLKIASKLGWSDAGTPRKRIQKFLKDSEFSV